MRFVTAFLSHPALVVLAICSLTPTLHATDWFVDVQSGNNANSGSTSTTPWRNVSFAVQQLTPLGFGPQTIHVAPGTYDAAHGEQFPIFMRPWLQIVGAQGSAVTILDGGGLDILHYDVYPGVPDSYDANCRTDGLTLRDSSTGITVNTSWNPDSPSFHDLHITLMSVGVHVATGSFGPHQAHPTFEGVGIDHCGMGVQLTANSSGAPPGSSSIATMSDCSVEACSGDGISMLGGFHMETGVDLTRCRIVGNAGHGIFGPGVGGTDLVSLRACLVAQNQLGGLVYPTTLGTCLIQDSTFAQNGLAGLQAVNGTSVTLRNSIFFGNADDLDAAGAALTASYCDSGDGDLNAQPNCISADPLFVGIGDYRLRFGSPCADSGDPATLASTLDLADNHRSIDGDLDTQERADRGCFEFAPLGLVTSGHIGTPLRLELWGPSGGMARVYFARNALMPPMSTPFGELDLGPNVGVLLVSAVAPGPPVAFQRPIPNMPGLVGHTFSFQSRTTSSLAPMGAAYTNAVSVTIFP